MEKAYRLLPWLTVTQAANWIEQLTETILSHDDFLQLCEAVQCPVYLNCQDWHGFAELPGCGSSFVKVPVIGAGYCVITRPTQLYEDSPLPVRGPAILDTSGKPEECDWFLPDYDETRGPALTPNDIQALAARMNAVADKQPMNDDAETLHSQLELERIARYVAEDEALGLRDELGEERAARQSAERRAEKAEAAAAKLRQEIDAAYCAQKADEELAARESHQRYIEGDPAYQLSHAIEGLIFPYSTKHLEAMRDAAVKFWQGHDITKPAPYGIQKTVQGFLAERTGENARKLAELAKAIKPDGLPKS